MARSIDLNADLGEGFGPWRMGNDSALLELVTSVNIACGVHAGDPDSMAETVQAATQRGVAIGAHPGLPDRQGFGRRDMVLTPTEVERWILYQLGALDGFVRAVGAQLNHVKPHGALYHQAAEDAAIAASIVRAVQAFDARLIVVGLPNSRLLDAARAAGLAVAAEGFIDRRYGADGGLIPRSHPNALLTDAEQAVAQALRLVERGEVVADSGEVVPVEIATLCLHGDTPAAVEIGQAVVAGLKAGGIELKPLERL